MSAPASITVAAAQYPLDPVPTLDAWRTKMDAWVADGAATGADLLVFPEYGLIELAATGGTAATADLATTLAVAADAMPDAISHLALLARRHGVHILAPSGPARHGEGYVNRACLIAPSGGVGAQDKLIMTPFERGWGIAPGGGAQVFETALGSIGIAICYDSEFPLLVRAMREAGAEIVLVPSCTEHLSGFHRVRTAAAARALENQIATMMSPTVGDAPWCAAVDRNTGRAGVLVPPDVALSLSGVIVEGRLDEPGWISARIDLAALRRLRGAGEMRNDSDWALQPGASDLARHVGIVRLT